MMMSLAVMVLRIIWSNQAQNCSAFHVIGQAKHGQAQVQDSANFAQLIIGDALRHIQIDRVTGIAFTGELAKNSIEAVR